MATTLQQWSPEHIDALNTALLATFCSEDALQVANAIAAAVPSHYFNPQMQESTWCVLLFGKALSCTAQAFDSITKEEGRTASAMRLFLTRADKAVIEAVARTKLFHPEKLLVAEGKWTEYFIADFGQASLTAWHNKTLLGKRKINEIGAGDGNRRRKKRKHNAIETLRKCAKQSQSSIPMDVEDSDSDGEKEDNSQEGEEQEDVEEEEDAEVDEVDEDAKDAEDDEDDDDTQEVQEDEDDDREDDDDDDPDGRSADETDDSDGDKSDSARTSDDDQRSDGDDEYRDANQSDQLNQAPSSNVQSDDERKLLHNKRVCGYEKGPAPVGPALLLWSKHKKANETHNKAMLGALGYMSAMEQLKKGGPGIPVDELRLLFDKELVICINAQWHEEAVNYDRANPDVDKPEASNMYVPDTVNSARDFMLEMVKAYQNARMQNGINPPERHELQGIFKWVEHMMENSMSDDDATLSERIIEDLPKKFGLFVAQFAEWITDRAECDHRPDMGDKKTIMNAEQDKFLFVFQSTWACQLAKHAEHMPHNLCPGVCRKGAFAPAISNCLNHHEVHHHSDADQIKRGASDSLSAVHMMFNRTAKSGRCVNL